MSRALVTHDPKWSARRKAIAELPRDVLEAQLISAEIDLELTKIDLELATKTIQSHAGEEAAHGEGSTSMGGRQ